MLPSKVFMLS